MGSPAPHQPLGMERMVFFQKRRLEALEVSAVGLGCATMTPFYDEPDSDAAIDTVRRAREIGVNSPASAV